LKRRGAATGTQGFAARQEEHEPDDVMNGNISKLTSFHVTGIKPALEVDDTRDRSLRPALFARYGDLAKLRYDYPLVLVESGPGGGFVQSVSDIVDEVLREIAPQGATGERLRKHVLRLEEELRGLVLQGAGGSLLKLWQTAERNLLARVDGTARVLLRDSLERARNSLHVDGEVLDCDAATPGRLITHAWTAVQAVKARATRKQIENLVLKLADILRADYIKTEEARSSDILRSSVGTAYDEAFDFDAMSGILVKGQTEGRLPDSRRQRVESALRVLQTQRFHAPLHDFEQTVVREPLYDFVFDSCAAALEAFQSRLPEMVEVIKAMSIAELEIQNLYRDSNHDSFFARFDEGALGPNDLALFPSYLVCLRDGQYDSAEKAKIFEALASDLPVKVLAQSDDILSVPELGAGQSCFAGGRPRLAGMALGLNNAFVLQTTSAGLYRMRQGILKGLTYDGPALFRMFSGSTENGPDVPPYLVAASAMESRAFPAFMCDPAAGPDWASRFSLDCNPQPESDWPVHRISYQDEVYQRAAEDVAFTFVDFAACDKRYGVHCVPVPRVGWHEDMVPVREYLGLDPESASGKVPYVLMVDQNDVLQRFVVDDNLIRAARSCSEMWRSLQELGGIDNSHARKLLDREHEIWEQEKERELAELRRRPEPEAERPAAVPVAAPAEAVEGDVAEPEEAPSSDEAYIETPRCTTCNECTELNNKMFAYDDNMQAYIVDPDAGPYRHLVEAAESCQVSIIHPGKPRNPAEPNLDKLLERAAPFN
jgi:hypothetical protein